MSKDTQPRSVTDADTAIAGNGDMVAAVISEVVVKKINNRVIQSALSFTAALAFAAYGSWQAQSALRKLTDTIEPTKSS